MSTQQKNGNGLVDRTKTPTAKTTTVLTPSTEEQKPEEQKPGAVVKNLPAVNELPPVEDRVLRVTQLYSIVEKLETLEETKKKLKAFKLSTDGSRDSLRIQDSKGNEFSTYNSSVIADVLEVLKNSIDRKIDETQKQIRF